MRLGDLDALKEYMDRPFWEKWEWEFICKSIDNAPTIIWCSETPEGLPLMDLRERLKDEWIPINEDTIEILKDHYWYLVAHDDFGTPLKAKFHSDCYGAHFTVYTSLNHFTEWLTHDDCKITHFMEMPEKPKDGDNNGSNR